jgi:hypothetical protein
MDRVRTCSDFKPIEPIVAPAGGKSGTRLGMQAAAGTSGGRFRVGKHPSLEI